MTLIISLDEIIYHYNTNINAPITLILNLYVILPRIERYGYFRRSEHCIQPLIIIQ